MTNSGWLMRLLMCAALCTVADGAFGGPGLAATSVEPDWRKVLADVCKSHRPEPACQAPEELSADQAWLILRHACSDLDETSEGCGTFRLNHPGVLLYDVARDSWDGQWEGKSFPPRRDIAGVPTFRLRPSEAKPLKIVVTSVSPLTYSARPGTPKEEDLAVIADLKGLLALAGAGVQGLARTIAFSAAAGVPEALPGATSGTGTDRVSPTASVVKKPGTGKAPSPPPDPCRVDAPTVKPLADVVRVRLEQLVALSAALRGLDSQLDALEERKVAFVRAAQRAEDGRPVMVADLSADVPDLTSAFTTLHEAAKTLDEGTFALVECQPLLGAYAALLSTPPKPASVEPFADAVLATGGCQALRPAIQDNARTLKHLAITASCEPTLKAHLELQREIAKPFVGRLTDAKQPEASIWQAVEKARASKKEVLAGAATLQRELEGARRHTWKGTLIQELVVTRQNPELRWNKVQSHSIVIKADSPYLKDLTLVRGTEEKVEYRLASATGDILGYGIGLIYTPLYESTWTAATIPGTSTKVIAETGRETRAGDLAAFLSYRFLEHRPAPSRRLQPTVDFGVGLTSGRPAFFVGIAAELFRAARVGFGWAPQRVSVLAPGQTVNETVVTSNDDIKTRTKFDTGHYYISVSFALDSLSLFNNP